MRWLIFGSTGWIGGILIKLLHKEDDSEIIYAKSRLDSSDICDELDRIRPDRVINAAGLTGTPNIDWLEDHKIEGLRVNVIGTLALLDACYSRNIHITQLATGCIYEYDDMHPIGGTPFVETDPPNFSGSYYSKTKRILEDLASPLLTNTLWLRIRMPLTPDAHPRNFITKISLK
jgi:dTDP-4-dehydrorhamnose reductase